MRYKFDPKKLKRYRIEKGISQSTLASMLGVNPKTIYRWEEGVSDPGTDRLNAICFLLNVEMEDLESYVGQEVSLTIPFDLHKKLSASAEANGHHITHEIIDRLDRSYDWKNMSEAIDFQSLSRLIGVEKAVSITQLCMDFQELKNFKERRNNEALAIKGNAEKRLNEFDKDQKSE